MHKYASLTIERKQPLRAVWPCGTASPAMNAWGQQKSNSTALCVQCSYHERHIAMRRSYCSLSSSFCGKKMGASPGQNSRWFWLSSEKKTTTKNKRTPPPSQSSLFEGSIMHSTPCKLLVFTNHGKERTWSFTELMHTHSKIKYCCTHRLAV